MRTRFPSSASKRQSERTGAAAVEAAIVIPLIALILLGSIDVGQSVYVAQVVNEASREGARQACRFDTQSESEVRATVLRFVENSFSGISDSAVDINFSDAGGNGIASGNLSSVATGSPISVQVSLDYDAVRWTPGFLGLGARSIATTTTMRRE
jgi:Flp pilus assembly protein TadG